MEEHIRMLKRFAPSDDMVVAYHSDRPQ